MSEFLIQLANTAPVSVDNPIRPRLLSAFYSQVETVVIAAPHGIGIDPFGRVTQLVHVMREALAIAEARTAAMDPHNIANAILEATREAGYPPHVVAQARH